MGLVVSSAAAKSSPAGCPVVLMGEVRQGEAFNRPIGTGLLFALEPVRNGWVIHVLPEQGSRPAVDYAAVVTPPFRSVNPLLLTTDWGFRAQDVVGWNPRSFHYVRSHANFASAEHAYSEALRSPHPSPAQTTAVANAVAASAEGKFEIVDARLLPGTADPSSAAAMLGTRFSTTAHSIINAEGGGPAGHVEQLRFRVTLGGSPASWGSKACQSSRH